jgi:NET1-associated nuclear protein 1 (U3 small nucleolar RNA-associated protein 17)
LSETTRSLPQGKCVSASMHWHAHAVTALAFNGEGDHVYSGGREGVLVSWQLRSGARSFLPRLGAALLSVAVSHDARWLAAACASNQVALVDAAEGRVARFVVGLRLAAPANTE